jgi:hypothetical protein
VRFRSEPFSIILLPLFCRFRKGTLTLSMSTCVSIDITGFAVVYSMIGSTAR